MAIANPEDHVNVPAVRKDSIFPSLRGTFMENWDSLWDDLDSLWADSWFNVPTRRAFSTVKSKEDKYELRMELPGVEPSEIIIDRKGNFLTVKAEQEKKETGSYFSFTKSMTLPEDANLEKIDASLKSGILLLTIPRIKTEVKEEGETVKIAVKS
jgi:HSP20 family protein